jgi:hypothetical protein
MTSEDQADKTSVSVEEIAAEARPLAAESDFGKMACRFLSTLHSWAAPSAVLCLCKDASAEAGWRSVSELAQGPASPAFERSIVKLIEDSAPGSLSQPVPVRPRDDVPGSGVKVRDNWLVPWTHGEAYGYLFIRGIAHTIPSFGAAVALLAQPLWSRLPGAEDAPHAAADATPVAAPLPALIDQAQQVAERLSAALREERERLASLNEQQADRAAEFATKLASAQRAGAEIESERDQARAEALALKGRLAEAEARARSAASSDQLDEMRRRVNELEGHAGELAERLAESMKTRREIESERDGARAEAVALRGRLEAAPAPSGATKEQLEALQKRLGELEGRAGELGEKLAAAEKARAELERERDQARTEATALKTRVEEAAAAPAPSEAAKEQLEALQKRLGELEGRLGELGEKLTAAEKARAELEKERDTAREEPAALKSKIAALEAQLGGDMHWEPVASEEVETLQKQLAELDTKYREAEKARIDAVTEREKLQTAAAAGAPASSAPEGGEAATAGGEGELSRAKAEANRLWQTVESLQKQLQKEAERLSEIATERERLAQTCEETKRERDAAQATLLAANEGMQEAVNRERGRAAQWNKLIASFRATADALRRTPFVPPALRVAFSDVEEALAAEGGGQERATTGRATGRVLFLDRDSAGVEQIAGELETAGLEVLIAHYPEEVGFFLKTPDARKLTAMVCDVMAFRGDQNLLDLFRAWRQDQSNLALLLSFKADSPAETEKAQRIPVVLTAGYLTRPLDRQAVLDAVGMIARRQGPR